MSEEGDANAQEPQESGPKGISPTVTIALVSALSALLGGGITAYMNFQTERQKGGSEEKVESGKNTTEISIKQMEVQGTLALEKQKEESAEKLARQEFETRLIMQAVQGATPDVASRNLQFFVKAGFIDDPDGKIARLSAEAPPVIPAPGTNMSGVALRDPAVCSKWIAEGLKGAATPMTQQDVKDVAAELGVEVAVLQAFMEVEGAKTGFVDGKPTIVFESRIFHAKTHGVYDKDYPNISSPTGGGYARGAGEYERLKQAMSLDCGAALASTSWGVVQQIGFDYRFVGFETIDDMIAELMKSERAQLEVLAKYMKASGLVEPLQQKDWKIVVMRFNGPAQVPFFQGRLAAAYAKYAGR